MRAFRTRLAEDGDVPAVAQLFDLYRQFYGMAADPGLAARFIAERMKNRESVILVSERGARDLVGFCQMYPTFCSVSAAPIYVLYDLFVADSARRSGAARALLVAAQEHALRNGFVRIDLSTAKTNRAAQSLYESLGWVRDEVFFTYSKQLVKGKAQ